MSNMNLAMIYLLLGCFLLIGAPLYVDFFSKNLRIKQVVEFSMAIYLIYAVFFHLLPESWAIIGYSTILLVATAYISFYVVDVELFKYQKAAKSLNFLILLGLTTHMLIDGAALGGIQYGLKIHSHSVHHFDSVHLGLSILVHRMPLAMILWKILRKQMNIYFALAMMLLLALANIFGFFFVAETTQFVNGTTLIATTQALVVGGLLHFFHDILSTLKKSLF